MRECMCLWNAPISIAIAALIVEMDIRWKWPDIRLEKILKKNFSWD